MPDRLVYTLRTAAASNTGPYQTAWDRAPVTSDGTIRRVFAVSPAITSNARQSAVDVYYQSDAPSFGSNTATTTLVTPITLVNNNDAVEGTVRQSGARVFAGGQLQLRTDAGTLGAAAAFRDLAVNVEVERD